MPERRRIEHKDWIAEGKERFGDDPMEWRFQCVRCGHVQTGRDFMEAGLSKEDAKARMYFSCIGRVNGGESGCDWSLGGLFQLHTLEVVDEEGVMPVFEFAPNAPAPEPATA